MPWHKNDHILVGNIDMRYSKNLVSFVAVDLRKHGAIEVFARIWKNKIALQKDESQFQSSKHCYVHFYIQVIVINCIL